MEGNTPVVSKRCKPGPISIY